MLKKIIVLLFVMGFFAVLWLPGWAAKAMEAGIPYLSEQMGREVSLENVQLTWAGRGEVDHLLVKDVQGDILKVEKAVFDLGLAALLDKRLLINALELRGAELTIRKGEKGLNISPSGAGDPNPSSVSTDQWIDWAKAAWNTWEEYRGQIPMSSDSPKSKEQTEKTETITSEGSEKQKWSFGLDLLKCSDLKMSFEGKDWHFTPDVTLAGLGESREPAALYLKGSQSFPLSLTLKKDVLEIKECPLSFTRSPVKDLSKLKGKLGLRLQVANSGDLTGNFELGSVEALIREDLPPLKDMTLSGEVSGSLKNPSWKLSHASLESIQKSLLSASKEKLRQEAQERIDKEVKDKLGEKIGKEAGDALSKGLKGLFGK